MTRECPCSKSLACLTIVFRKKTKILSMVDKALPSLATVHARARPVSLDNLYSICTDVLSGLESATFLFT